MGYGSAERSMRDIDRKRERERQQMLGEVYRRAEELAIRLVTRLLDEHIVETNSDKALRELFEGLLKELSRMDESDIQYKTAPLRAVVTNPNFISQYITQYIIEDLLNHRNVQDVFGDDLDIYRVVDSVFSPLRMS